MTKSRKSPDRLPKEHDGQLFMVFDETPIERSRQDLLQYYDQEARKMHILHPDFKNSLLSVQREVIQKCSKRHVRETISLHSAMLEMIRGDKVYETILQQEIRGELAHVLHVDCRGGSGAVAREVQSINGFAESQKANTTGFLRHEIMSAAFDIMMQLRHRVTSKRSEFLWHEGSYSQDALGNDIFVAAEMLHSLKERNQQKKGDLEEFLSTNVKKSKRQEAMQAMKLQWNQADDHRVRISGSTMADWELATLVTEQNMPSDYFRTITGIDSASLQPNNAVRRFIEGFDEYVGRESFIRSVYS